MLFGQEESGKRARFCHQSSARIHSGRVIKTVEKRAGHGYIMEGAIGFKYRCDEAKFS